MARQSRRLSGLFNSDGTVITGLYESFDHSSETLADTDVSIYNYEQRPRKDDHAISHDWAALLSASSNVSDTPIAVRLFPSSVSIF